MTNKIMIAAQIISLGQEHIHEFFELTPMGVFSPTLFYLVLARLYHFRQNDVYAQPLPFFRVVYT